MGCDEVLKPLLRIDDLDINAFLAHEDRDFNSKLTRCYVEALISKGADVNFHFEKMDTKNVCCFFPPVDIKHGKGRTKTTALSLAAMNGHIHVVKLLTESGVDVNNLYIY